MQSVHALHHGREIQCVQLLQAPEPHQGTAVITGGEDSTLRSFLLRPNGTGHMVSKPSAASSCITGPLTYTGLHNVDSTLHDKRLVTMSRGCKQGRRSEGLALIDL